jgi:serine/threonine-protein kinase
MRPGSAGAFPPHLVAFIGAQTLAGLIHAYRRQHNGKPVMTAHRDISPSNILVSREGEVKVTDFGIARLEGMSVGTQPGTFKGKLPYASPETLLGEPATAASDQFALGIVLYELLTGQHPFGEGLSPTALAHAIPTREPTPLPPALPAPLAAGVMRALAKEPQARFARPEDMAEALARYLAQAGEPASSQALATFLAELHLPPTLLELGEQSAQEPEGPEATARTLRSQQFLPTRPVHSASFELDGDPWVAVPGGPSLDASGKLVGSPAPVEDLSPVTLPAEELPTFAPAERPVIHTSPEEPLELAERAPRKEVDVFALADAEASRLAEAEAAGPRGHDVGPARPSWAARACWCCARGLRLSEVLDRLPGRSGQQVLLSVDSAPRAPR